MTQSWWNYGDVQSCAEPSFGCKGLWHEQSRPVQEYLVHKNSGRNHIRSLEVTSAWSAPFGTSE